MIERAGELEQSDRDAGIARARAALPQGESAEHCSDCGTDIPEGRRLAMPGVKFCVDCQTRIEKRGNL
jgi:phage/conjugal plasmid C-4 type zinc finger TraR family protein